MRSLPFGTSVTVSPTATTTSSKSCFSPLFLSKKQPPPFFSPPSRASHDSSLSKLGFSVPAGCRRTCLVAVIGGSVDDTLLFGSEDFKIGGFDGKFCLNRGYVTGILTVDTVADFLPRKGPLRQRRTGIAYISNVAVRERFRRKGIAKRLIAKAEAQARSWGCRAIALHCDLNNPGATKLYKGQGFRSIKVPEGANWPQPKTSPDVKFNFMMKLLNTPTTA
ncbi:hypothetical protein CRYUN_Cryun09bG0085500 [Craigia yunnanensis]